MKTSTKLCLITGFLFISFFSFSQQYIVKGGLNLATQFHKTNDGKLSSDYSLNPGFHLGVLMENALSDNIFINWGLVLSQKGFSSEFGDTNEPFKFTMNPLYLDFPVQFKFTKSIKENLKLFGALGPYLGIGFGGTNKFDFQGRTTEIGIKWGGKDTDSDYKNPDFGLTFDGGLEINSFLFSLGYDLGMANISPTSYNSTILQNRVIKVSLGYKFGG